MDFSASQPDYFEANFALLKKHYPVLWQKFRENPPQPTGEIIFSPQGLPNLRVQKADGKSLALHIEQDPTQEIPQFLKLVPPRATGFVAFLGMGLGYAPLAFLAERPNIVRMVIFELDEGIFWQALQVMDLAPLLNNPRVNLLVGPTPDIARSLSGYMAEFTTESIYTLNHLSASELNREGYSRLKADFFQFSNALNIGGNTLTAYGKTFVENRFRQLSGIGHDYFLDTLQNAFAGVPAILVAGGPSLNKNIHLLSQAQEKAVVISVDTVIPPLMNHNVTPDFVGSIDMQPTTYEKFADHANALSEVSLICVPWVTYKVPKYLDVARVFWFFAQNNMEQWLNSCLGGKVTLPGAGTVAQLNFFAAVLLGCSPIIFVGQDFAFSDDQDHVENIVLSHRERVQKLLHDKKELHHVPGTLGGTVATDRSYLSMKETFETTIRSNPNVYINATEGGAHIEGTRVMPLQDALDEFCQARATTVKERIDEKLREASHPNLAALVDDLRQQHKAGGGILKTIVKSDELGAGIIGEVEKLTRRAKMFTCFERLPQGLQKKLRKNDELHGKIDREKVWHLLQDITMDGLRSAARLKVEIDRLKDDPAQYLLWLRKNMERVLEINKVRHQVLADFLAKASQVIDNFEQERELASRDATSLDSLLELARFYTANADIRLARPLLEKMKTDYPDSAEVLFLLGKVAALQVDFTAAEGFFAEAVRISPAIEEEIRAFRRQCAEEYLGFARQRIAKGMKVAAKNMILKGLRYDPDHPGLQKLLRASLTGDLALITADAANGADLLRFWRTTLDNYPHLAANLEAEQLSEIYFAAGQELFARDEYAAALVQLTKAAEHDPENSMIQVAIFEAAFNNQQFDVAVAALDRAVMLDRALAGHWEELGDLLFSAGQAADALAAYEKCFLVQQHNHGLLKKIGDCYLALDQPEAAHEAYRQLTLRLGNEERS